MPTLPLILIDPTTKQPLYRQVETQLRDAILAGRIQPGYRLPGARKLAEELGLGRITVTAAYDQLAADGYIDRTVGSGSRVACRLPEPFEFGPRRSDLPGPVAERTPGELDLRRGKIAVDLVQFGLWERLLRTALRDLVETGIAELETLAGSDGDPLLRAELAAFLGAARGISCRSDQVFIVSSAQAACSIVADMTASAGPWVVEDPGDRDLRASIQARCGVVPIPIDEAGLKTDRLPDRAGGALVSPAWQFPCGGTMAEERRKRLLDWGRSTGATIVETDFEGHIRLAGKPTRPLRARDDADGVVYLGTFSTILFPGIRTAFAVVPNRLVEPFRASARRHEGGAAAIEQRALGLFLRDGHLARHVVRVRKTYRLRQLAFQSALSQHLGNLMILEPTAYGTHALARLIGPMTSAQLVDIAGSVGVEFESLASYAIESPVRDAIVASFARAQPSELDRSLGRVASVLRGQSMPDQVQPPESNDLRPYVIRRIA